MLVFQLIIKLPLHQIKCIQINIAPNSPGFLISPKLNRNSSDITSLFEMDSKSIAKS